LLPYGDPDHVERGFGPAPSIKKGKLVSDEAEYPVFDITMSEYGANERYNFPIGHASTEAEAMERLVEYFAAQTDESPPTRVELRNQGTLWAYWPIF
jgi:hypothetical protein